MRAHRRRSAGSPATSSGASSHEADVLCAPSLSGESFGMVLTEAFAAGHAGDRLGRSPATATSSPTASTASSSRPADPQRLAEELQRARHEPERLRGDGRGRRARSAERYAWPRVADQVDRGLRAGDRACPRRSAPPSASPAGPGFVRADGGPRRPAQRLPSLDPAPARARQARPPRRPPDRPRRRRRRSASA